MKWCKLAFRVSFHKVDEHEDETAAIAVHARGTNPYGPEYALDQKKTGGYPASCSTASNGSPLFSSRWRGLSYTFRMHSTERRHPKLDQGTRGDAGGATAVSQCRSSTRHCVARTDCPYRDMEGAGLGPAHGPAAQRRRRRPGGSGGARG